MTQKLDKEKIISNTVIAAVALTVTLLTFFVFLSSINNGFVNWDDIDYVYENTNIRQLNTDTIKWAFQSKVVDNWYPLTLLSYAVDYAMWGNNAWGYHLTNVFLHACNALLTFILASLIISHAKGSMSNTVEIVIAAAIASLLFSLHPLKVESVVWISGRKDMLSAFFFLLAALAYVFYARTADKNKTIFYILSIIFYVFSLMSKPSVIMFPLILILLDWYPLNRFDLKKSIVEKTPFFALSALSAVMTMQAIYGSAKTVVSVQSGVIERISTAAYSTVFYLYKMIVPFSLSPLYPVTTESIGKTVFVVSIAAIAVISMLCVYSLKKEKAPLAVWLYYLIMLVPVMGFLKFGRQLVADRFTYLPLIAFWMFIGAYAAQAGKTKISRTIKLTVIAAICVVYAVLSICQTRVWKDSLTLWTRQIELYPGRSGEAYNNRGSAYYVLGDYATAIKDYDIAIGLKTENKDAYFNRAYARYYSGDHRGAFEDFKKYEKYDKKDAGTFLEIGKIFINEKDYFNAATALGAAVRLDPELTEAQDLLNKIRSGKKRRS